jgi:hypothetical protein
MSTPSLVLFGGGVAASLTGVWALAGLSERSETRSSARAVTAVAVGVLGLGAVYLRTPAALRGELLLPGLFGVVAVLALGAGAAKLDAALADRNGARAVRRAAGLIAGTFLGMASVAFVSFELLLTSLAHARFGWAYMLPLVLAALIVFLQRGRLAGAGALLLGGRGLVLAVVGLALLGSGRLLVTARATAVPLPRAAASAEAPPPAPTPEIASAAPAPEAAPSAEPAPSASAAIAASASAPAPVAGVPGELQVEAVSTRGMLEADARGGVARRMPKLQACLEDANNQQSGALSLKIGIDAAGSVAYAKATGGELMGTPLAACLLPIFYKMGFASPPSSAYFEITLRSPSR